MLNASLDTSFWNIAAQIGVVPYLFSFFDVHYCQAVEREVITTDPDETPLVYPQAMLFQVMREAGNLHQVEPTDSLGMFGAGEAGAIALAQEHSWVLLINDYHPLRFAESLGIRCVSVPGFCILLYAEGKISVRAIRGYLRRLRPTTSPALIAQAEKVVRRIAAIRGDVP